MLLIATAHSLLVGGRGANRVVCRAGSDAAQLLRWAAADGFGFLAGAVTMVMLATLTAVPVTISGRSAWFVGALVLMVHLMFATALYLLPPQEG